jgi:DNA topoisomerase IA
MSAGRVQSVALRLICDRDEERSIFNSSEYWSLNGDMEFEKNYIHHLVFQLLPSSRKPKEINEVSKSKKIMEKLKSNNKVELKDILKRESEDVIELIKKLGDLHSAGILTDEEFSNKKSELLSKI